MIKILLLVSALALITWDDPGNPPGSVAKYIVYQGTNISGTFLPIGETGTNGFEAPRLRSGTHFFYVTAVGTNAMESDPSNNLRVPVVNPPSNVVLRITVP